MSGELVAVGSLVAESLLRHLPTVPEGLQALLHYQFDQCDWVVPVPANMLEIASTLGILAVLFLPDSGEGEPCFASLSEIYVSQELAAGGMPKDEEEAAVLDLGFAQLRRLLHRSVVVSCSKNVAYWSFRAELEFLGCSSVISLDDCGNGAKTRIVQFGADEFGTNREALILKDHLALCPKSLADPSKLWSPVFASALGVAPCSSEEFLMGMCSELVMLSLYRLLELALAEIGDGETWTWKERLEGRFPSGASALAASCSQHGQLPVLNWEGRLVSGDADVWACRSSWFLDTVLDASPYLFIHREIAEHCPRLVAAAGWLYLEGRTTILWQQSNNNPEKELLEASEAFGTVLKRPVQVVSCNWIALEVIFSPRAEPKEGEWFSEIPGLIKERIRAQPSFAILGQGVVVLATHFVKEASERAALAAAALALALALQGLSKREAQVLARSTCESIRSFTSERFWEASSGHLSHAGYNLRQVPGTEVLLPIGVGEEASLPGLMGSFGGVEQYDDEESVSCTRFLPLLDQRRDHEVFGEVIGRILSEKGMVSSRRTTAASIGADVAAVKEQQRRVGERAEHFYSCFLERVFGDAYKPTRDWVSSARSRVYPGSRSIDDSAGFDFVITDTAQRIVPSQGKRSVRCFIEVKGCTGSFTGMFCLSANEQRKRDQIAASKNDANAYVIAVVDNMESLELASIRHFLWSEELKMIQLEAESFIARVDPHAGNVVSNALMTAGASAEDPPSKAAPSRPCGRGRPPSSTATVSVPSGKVGLVIGKGGATVKWIMNESGAKVQVADGSTAGLSSLKIEGSKEQIEAAKQLIQEVVYGQADWHEWRSGRVWKGNSNGGGWQ
ncbi:Far upstream element-binding protein 1 (FBP) (FUSE-binding protein 1) [Durusdinium trenchii]|uniref:Far upstream element-binding protein 1 (FBP) (FUSE-binding protein 1) n=1 Tax=Durusdinium trenchii TaxID=1381693 RepID=A0ABP0HVF6_9DINO